MMARHGVSLCKLLFFGRVVERKKNKYLLSALDGLLCAKRHENFKSFPMENAMSRGKQKL